MFERSAIQAKITLISDHNRSTMDTGDDDYSGHSKKLAGGFLTPNAWTLTDSWKLWEQVALVSYPEPNRFGNPFQFPLTSVLPSLVGKSDPVILFASHPTTELPSAESSFKSRMLFSFLLSHVRITPPPPWSSPITLSRNWSPTRSLSFLLVYVIS